MRYSLLFGYLLLLSTALNSQRTYYIDTQHGSDSSAGVSPTAAWRSLDRISRESFAAGDSILFKSGQAWRGSVQFRGGGRSGRPVYVGKYGDGLPPAIHGEGGKNYSAIAGEVHFATVYLYNPQYWELNDLEITNYAAEEEGGLTRREWEIKNVIDYAERRWPEQHVVKRVRKSGVLVEARDAGALHHLYFSNLRVHGVNGDMTKKHNGGIFFAIFGAEGERPTYFDDLRVEGCHIHDVDRTGISNVSYYEKRTVDTVENWTPSRGYLVRDNIFQRTGANALIVRISDAPMVENNLFDHCSIKGSGNALFNFNTDNMVMQYNEARHTKYNLGDHDAGGIDSDYRTKNTTIQYNYIHDNDFGPLITGGPRKTGGFNVNTVVRYNIFENDGLLRDPVEDKYNWIFKISGDATGTLVHNNVFYVGPGKQNRAMIYHKNWGGGIPDSSAYFNNVFYNLGGDIFYQLEESRRTRFHNNHVYGNRIEGQPENAGGANGAPGFQAAGTGPDGYRLRPGSPLLGKGTKSPTNATPTNFYGDQVSEQANIGAQ